jgi:hypothetical protein
MEETLNVNGNLLLRLPVEKFLPVGIKCGYGEDNGYRWRFPDETGELSVEIRQMECLELKLEQTDEPNGKIEAGYQDIAGEWRPLPTGSILDTVNAKYNWQPGPGFAGTFRLVFLVKDNGGHLGKKYVNVTITRSPKRFVR